jgi:aspartate carbamoyltransferase
MDLSQFDLKLNRPIRMKTPELERSGRLKHVIFSSQFSRMLLEKLHLNAEMIRELSRSKLGIDSLRELLSHKRAMLYFTQPSTRTFLSFMAACQILGITCNEVRDPSTSSEVKRESPLDSIRMFSSYFDFIIMRSIIPDLAECCAYLMNDLEQSEMRSVPIINAGAGADEHPTQALLDIYTIQRTFEFDHREHGRQTRLNELRKRYHELTTGPDYKTYLFCGDLGRGRTVRSLATLLACYEGITMYFVSPDHDKLRLSRELRDRLIDHGATVHEFNSLDESLDGVPILEKIDCLYMTRIQREHDKSSDADAFSKIDFSQYQLTEPRVDRMKEYAPILHPFPRDSVMNEIPTVIDDNPRAMYFRQARNGMWARAALLIHLFDCADDLHMLYNRFYRENSERQRSLI